MKAIGREDLLLLISLNKNKTVYFEDDFESLLKRFGDDWFVTK